MTNNQPTDISDAEAREIARRLTPAQKRALIWLPEDGAFGAYSPDTMWQQADALSAEGLIRVSSCGDDSLYCPLPLGLRVRAILTAQQGSAEA